MRPLRWRAGLGPRGPRADSERAQAAATPASRRARIAPGEGAAELLQRRLRWLLGCELRVGD